MMMAVVSERTVLPAHGSGLSETCTDAKLEHAKMVSNRQLENEEKSRKIEKNRGQAPAGKQTRLTGGIFLRNSLIAEQLRWASATNTKY